MMTSSPQSRMGHDISGRRKQPYIRLPTAHSDERSARLTRRSSTSQSRRSHIVTLVGFMFIGAVFLLSVRKRGENGVRYDSSALAAFEKAQDEGRPSSVSTATAKTTSHAVVTYAPIVTAGLDGNHFTVTRGADGRRAKLLLFGKNFGFVKLPKEEILKLPVTEKLDAAAFNLALLRMPEDCEWPFIGIARSPLNHITKDSVPGTDLAVQLNSLLGFGLKLEQDGTFKLISKASFLQIPMRPAFECGTSAIFQGPEDPRTYWSDAGLPMLIMGVPSTIGRGHCRGIGLVHDLRSVWPDLTSILATSKHVPPFHAGAHGDDIVELTRAQAMWQEKNWMPFFPGPKPDGRSLLPHMHYNSHPEEILVPPQQSFRKGADQNSIYEYRLHTSPAHDTSSCIVKHHPNVFDKVHGATPLYRLTLCNRGTCQPNKDNTVLFALTHYLMEADSRGERAYTRFFSFWSVEQSTAPLAMGPMFQYGGGADNSKIIYALTMAFVPRQNSHNSQFGNLHGFLDDRLFISTGVADSALATIELSIAQEVLRGLRACDIVRLPSAFRAYIYDDSSDASEEESEEVEV